MKRDKLFWSSIPRLGRLHYEMLKPFYDKYGKPPYDKERTKELRDLFERSIYDCNDPIAEYLRFFKFYKIECDRQSVTDAYNKISAAIEGDFEKYSDDKPNKPKPKEQKQKDDSIRTSFIENKNIIYEQTSTNQYIDSEGQWHTEVVINSLVYKPNVGEELVKGIVLLPDMPEEYIDIQTLVEDIRLHLHKYYDCDEQTEKFSAWYVLLSWVYDKLNTINYLRAMGDWGTGKSRFGDVVGRICYKPILGSGAGSVAALKRMVNKWRGTVISDEGDFKDDDEKNELVKFYNLGFEKNRCIYQCDKNDPNKIEFYIPYCPKIILTRRDFKDKALESRCMTHITKVTTREDIPIHLPHIFYVEEMKLRNKLLKFRIDYYFKIDSDKVLTLNLGNIEPRLKQAMGSYAVLFANLPQMFESFKLYLAEYQEALIDDRAGSFDGLIINAIVDLLLIDKKYITCGMIAEELSQSGINTTLKTISSHLKQLGFKISKPIFFEGKTIKPIIIHSDSKDILLRYVSDKEKITHVTDITDITKRCAGTETQTIIINKNFYCERNTGNNSNVGNVEEENIKINDKENKIKQNNKYILSFDDKCHVWHFCAYPTGNDELCNDTPCNEFKGLFYCRKHFEAIQGEVE